VTRRLELAPARRSAGLHPGDHRAPGVGVGTELAQLRPYQPGDDVRQLDPAATARTAIPHVRLQVPERLLTTWIVLDLSPSMAFGTAERLKSDVAEGAVRVISRLALRRAGRVALLTCGCEPPRLLPPRGGRPAMAAVERLLAEGLARDGEGAGEDLARAIGRLARIARRPGLVIVVSDFRDRSEWPRALRSLGTIHSLLAIEARDPREETLPAAGHLTLVDPETGAQLEVDTGSATLRREYAEAEARERRAVAEALRRARAEHVVLSTAGPWLRELGRALR
jgi:uncharacterized protein (DUF58 family)